MVKRIIGFAGILVFIINVSITYAQDLNQDTYFNYGFKEFGILTGFMDGELDKKDDYEVIPFILRFGFDLRPLIKNKSNNLLEFLVEPFMSAVINPDSNLETGCNFLIKFAPAITPRFYPYVEGGVGLIYMTQHTREQSTQFNFTQTVGAGITYFIKKDLNLSLGYRYRHLSNASIKSPNKGIDSNSIICGIAFFY